MEKENCDEKFNDKIDNEIRLKTELDPEAFNVILRLYDKTFRYLVDK